MKTWLKVCLEKIHTIGKGLPRNSRYPAHKEALFPVMDNHSSRETGRFTRREIIKNLAALPVLGLVFWNLAGKRLYALPAEERELAEKSAGESGAIRFKTEEPLPGHLRKSPETLGKSSEVETPQGKIGDLQVSRLIIGGNLISGYAHSRDLVYVSNLVKEYHTDEKVIETLFLCEEYGINTAILRTDENTVRVLREYRRRGGSIQWIAQYYPSYDNMDNVHLALDNGAAAAFSQGARADSFISNERADILQKSLEYIRDWGIPSGIGAHTLQVPVTCEERGLNPDYYMKTLHHHEFWSAPPKEDRDAVRLNNWSPQTRQTIAFMNTVDCPWIAFKVLAAGAIRPENGIKYAFENGADFACVGMFDFQIRDNVAITARLFQEGLSRARPWRG